MKTAVAIRHVHFEDLGTFAPVLEARGYAIRYVDAATEDLADFDAGSPDLLAILGGPLGAYEEDKYPFLVDELALIGRRVAAGRASLGLCLGAQLLARAMGAEVKPGPAKEIGWAPVTLTDAGKAGPLRHLGSDPVMHWHGDCFDLPSGAERLAFTELCPIQAFSKGPAILGCQFHPEASDIGFERWLVGHANELGAERISPNALRRDAAMYGPAAAQRGRLVIAAWLDGL